jgi:hypothetical protein
MQREPGECFRDVANIFEILPECNQAWSFSPIAAAVILREGGGSSTPRLHGSITNASEYWIARFRGR